MYELLEPKWTEGWMVMADEYISREEVIALLRKAEDKAFNAFHKGFFRLT